MSRFQSISPQTFVSSSLLVSPPVNVSVKFTISCGSSSHSLPVTVQNGNGGKTSPERTEIRLGLPSKGRMATDTLDLLRDCQLSVKQVNPRQYVAEIPQIPNLEVWFQRPKDVVRKLVSGDLDLGIVGLDTVTEYGQGNEDLVIVHENLEYGDCHLSIAIPKYGIFKNINSLEELAQMPQWTPERPLRVATGFNYMAPIFLSEKGLKHVTFSTADGALEAAPAMGIADAIVDLVSSGTTLRENNLKEIEGGTMLESQGNEDLVIVHDNLEYGDCHFSIAIPKYGIFENIISLKELAQMPQWTHERPLGVATGLNYMGIADAIVDLVSSGTTLRENNLKEIEGGIMLESRAVFVASRKSLTQRKGVLDITHEMLERLEAHLRAAGQFKVTANMRGSTAEEVAERILSQPSLSGLQGPTISPVYCKRDGKMSVDYYAIVICVPKKELYKSVKQLRAIGGSGGVLISSPLTYIFDEETPRWGQLLAKLGV